jgi:hypothetical protein
MYVHNTQNLEKMNQNPQRGHFRIDNVLYVASALYVDTVGDSIGHTVVKGVSPHIFGLLTMIIRRYV